MILDLKTLIYRLTEKSATSVYTGNIILNRSEINAILVYLAELRGHKDETRER